MTKQQTKIYRQKWKAVKKTKEWKAYIKIKKDLEDTKEWKDCHKFVNKVVINIDDRPELDGDLELIEDIVNGVTF